MTTSSPITGGDTGWLSGGRMPGSLMAPVTPGRQLPLNGPPRCSKPHLDSIPQREREVLCFCEVLTLVTQKQPPSHESGRRAAEAVLAVFPRSAKVGASRRGVGAGLTINGQSLTIQWIGEGRLGDARRILSQRRNRPDIVLARRMSPGARHALSEAGVGWVDETGAAEIATRSVIVSRTGTPPKPDSGIKRWSPAVAAVAEALLCGVKATVSDTQSATGLSEGSCTNALRFLSDQGLLVAAAKRGRGSGRRVKDENELLSAYAGAIEAALPLPPALEVGVTWRDSVTGLIEVGKRWNKAGIAWAATGAVAASAIAPYLTSVTHAAAYVNADNIVGLESVAGKAGLKPIEGGRLTLKPFPTAAARTLAKEVDGLKTAPWPRVYVDLLSEGVRGEEAAEHLLEVVRAR